jgi:hypothetical protein
MFLRHNRYLLKVGRSYSPSIARVVMGLMRAALRKGRVFREIDGCASDPSSSYVL